MRIPLLLTGLLGAAAALVTCAPLAPAIEKAGDIRLHLVYAAIGLVILRGRALAGLPAGVRNPLAAGWVALLAGAVYGSFAGHGDWLGANHAGALVLVPLGALLLLAETGRRGLRRGRVLVALDGMGVLLVLGVVAAAAAGGDLGWLAGPGLPTLALWSALHALVQAAGEELAFREVFFRLCPPRAALAFGSFAFALSHGLVGLGGDGGGNLLRALLTNLGLGFFLGMLYREGGLLASSLAHGVADGLLLLVGPGAGLLSPGRSLVAGPAAQTYLLYVILGFWVAALLWGIRLQRRREERGGAGFGAVERSDPR